jgi:Protein of unknown function (DUF3054)
VRRGWVLFDVAVVLAFVVIGRASHHHGETLAGITSTAWPFALGLGAGWLVVAVRGGSGRSVADGGVIVATTVAVGMVLRVLAGQGTAVAFVVVALAFNGLWMLGARSIAPQLRRRA